MSRREAPAASDDQVHVTLAPRHERVRRLLVVFLAFPLEPRVTQFRDSIGDQIIVIWNHDEVVRVRVFRGWRASGARPAKTPLNRVDFFRDGVNVDG